MSSEFLDMEQLSNSRREAIAKSVKTIRAGELKAAGEDIFQDPDDPWREQFFSFIAEHPAATFHYATTHEGVHVIYCHSEGKGMWFLPGSGKGVLGSRSLAMMKEIVGKPH